MNNSLRLKGKCTSDVQRSVYGPEMRSFPGKQRASEYV